MMYKPYTFWDLLLTPQKKSTHKHFLSAKNPHENNKKSGQKVKSVQKKCWFSQTPSKVYGLYTRENVDIYGRPLTKMIDTIFIV